MGKTITRESQITEQSVDIQKLPKMKFFLIALILVGTYCFAAGLDEVSDKLSPRMRQRPGLRRITQSRRDAETLYRVSNQTRQAWNHPWNYDSNKGGPNFVEMALLGTTAERVIPDTVDCVWRRAGAGNVVNRESAP